MPPRIPQSSKIPLDWFRLSVCQSLFPQMSRAPPARVGVMGESHQHQMKTVMSSQETSRSVKGPAAPFWPMKPYSLRKLMNSLR